MEQPHDKQDSPDFYALLTEFETLILDANESQLPRRAQLPVQKRLNEVRAQLQSFGRITSAALETQKTSKPTRNGSEALDREANVSGTAGTLTSSVASETSDG